MPEDKSSIPFSIVEFADGLSKIDQNASSIMAKRIYPNFGIDIKEDIIDFSCFCVKAWPMTRIMGQVTATNAIHIILNDLDYHAMGRLRIYRDREEMTVAPIVEDRPDLVTDSFLREIEFDRSDYLVMLNPAFFAMDMEKNFTSLRSYDYDVMEEQQIEYEVEREKNKLLHVLDIQNDGTIFWENFEFLETMEVL